MNKVRALTLIALAGGLFGAANADTLQMGEFASRFESPDKPKRGMTQTRVEASFGTPQSRQAPVGDPPITRWDYEDFAVFFEYDRVIHAVAKR